MWNLEEAARTLNVPLELLCRLVRSGLLPVFNVDGEVKVRVDDVSDIVETTLARLQSCHPAGIAGDRPIPNDHRGWPVESAMKPKRLDMAHARPLGTRGWRLATQQVPQPWVRLDVMGGCGPAGG